jgi:hypothetical protein
MSQQPTSSSPKNKPELGQSKDTAPDTTADKGNELSMSDEARGGLHGSQGLAGAQGSGGAADRGLTEAPKRQKGALPDERDSSPGVV